MKRNNQVLFTGITWFTNWLSGRRMRHLHFFLSFTHSLIFFSFSLLFCLFLIVLLPLSFSSPSHSLSLSLLLYESLQFRLLLVGVRFGMRIVIYFLFSSSPWMGALRHVVNFDIEYRVANWWNDRRFLRGHHPWRLHAIISSGRFEKNASNFPD